jgi:hypothetical protein
MNFSRFTVDSGSFRIDNLRLAECNLKGYVFLPFVNYGS